MGKTTGIAWADSTFNPWIGCTRVSPGCDHCYAEALDARYQWGGAKHWGPGVPRHRTSSGYWHQAVIWNRIARDHGKVHRVFPSLCDPFDNEVPEEWRADLFGLIADTPHLTWLLLTKRIGNVEKMLPALGHWDNADIGASIVNQEEADRDLDRLVAITRFRRRFVSYEPAIGPVDWRRWLEIDRLAGSTEWVRSGFKPEIDWVIVGGESNQGGDSKMSHSIEGAARPFELEWARSTIEQCRAAGVAVFMKQLGSCWHGAGVKDRAGADPEEWPEDLRVQEFPA